MQKSTLQNWEAEVELDSFTPEQMVQQLDGKSNMTCVIQTPDIPPTKWPLDQFWASEKETQLRDNGSDRHLNRLTLVTLGHCTKISTKNNLILTLLKTKDGSRWQWKGLWLFQRKWDGKTQQFWTCSGLEFQSCPEVSRESVKGEDMVETFRMELLL